MIYICKHDKNFTNAYDTKEMFARHRKVKEEPEILYKLKGRKGSLTRTYIVSIKLS